MLVIISWRISNEREKGFCGFVPLGINIIPFKFSKSIAPSAVDRWPICKGLKHPGNSAIFIELKPVFAKALVLSELVSLLSQNLLATSFVMLGISFVDNCTFLCLLGRACILAFKRFAAALCGYKESVSAA